MINTKDNIGIASYTNSLLLSKNCHEKSFNF